MFPSIIDVIEMSWGVVIDMQHVGEKIQTRYVILHEIRGENQFQINSLSTIYMNENYKKPELSLA